MKLSNLILPTVAAILLFSCTKKDSGPADHSYKVGDTTFSGSFVDVYIAERHYLEKEILTLPVGLDTMVRIKCYDYDSMYYLTGTVYTCIRVKDSFATYGLGGHANSRKAFTLRYNGGANKTGTFQIRSAEIYVDSSGTRFRALSGLVNIFHYDTSYMQGTFSGDFSDGSVSHSVNGNFKIYHTQDH